VISLIFTFFGVVLEAMRIKMPYFKRDREKWLLHDKAAAHELTEVFHVAKA